MIVTSQSKEYPDQNSARNNKKGKGYEPAEKDQIVWYAPGTFDKSTGKRNEAHL